MLPGLERSFCRAEAGSVSGIPELLRPIRLQASRLSSRPVSHVQTGLWWGLNVQHWPGPHSQ